MKKAESKKKRKPPSREKYERENRVISFRAPKEIFASLQEVKDKEGRSYLDIIKVGLGRLEVRLRAEKEVRQIAYDEGWEKGVTEAMDLYTVTYPCSVCGREIEVTTDEEKDDIRVCMRNHGWGHAECHNKRRRHSIHPG